MNMGKVFARYKWMGIILGVLLIAAGIAIVVVGIIKPSNLDLLLSVIAATMFFVVGTICLVGGCLVKLTSFFNIYIVLGGLAIAIGVVLLVYRNATPMILLYTTAVTLIALGATYVVRAILYISNKMKPIYIVISFVIAVVAITAGILALVYQGRALQVIYILFGLFVVAIGGYELAITLKGSAEKD